MRPLLFLALLFLATIAAAHPGIGIVRDAQGNIYYTDLIHVWRITPQGEKSIVVREVHTHELAIDQNDNLYGEDLRYTGEDDNRWFHSIWKRSRIGEVTSIEKARVGYRNDFGFARDQYGNQYWIFHEDNGTARIRRRTVGGTVSTLTPNRDLGLVNWVSVSPDGKTLYLAASRNLYKMAQNGEVELLLPDDERGRHSLMGMSAQASGTLYVADYGQQVVKKITKDGTATIALKTDDPWSPSGVCAAPDGTLWVLEFSDRNEARVRRIGVDGRVKVF